MKSFVHDVLSDTSCLQPVLRKFVDLLVKPDNTVAEQQHSVYSFVMVLQICMVTILSRCNDKILCFTNIIWYTLNFILKGRKSTFVIT